MPDNTKKPAQSTDTDKPAEKVEELTQKPITDRDAQTVKGGLGKDKPKWG